MSTLVQQKSFLNEQLPRYKEIASNLNYRDWKIEAYVITAFREETSTHIRLGSDVWVTCAQGGNDVLFDISVEYDGTETESEIIQRFFEAIKEFEDHEREEWFQYKGKCVYDPHPELVKRR